MPLPDECYKSLKQMQGVVKRTDLLAENYGKRGSDQLKKVVNTRGTNKLELNWRDTDTFRVVCPEIFYHQGVHLRKDEPFPHQNIDIIRQNSSSDEKYLSYMIDTRIPLPTRRRSHLNTKAPNFLEQLAKLLLPENPALTIPNKILTYPHFSETDLRLLQRSERSLNEAVLDAAQIKKVFKQVGLY
jgi:hypothetical protein